MADLLPVWLQTYEHRAAALISIASLVVLAYVVYNASLSPLHDIPGPLSARTGLGSYMARRAMKQDFGWKVQALHDQYGPIVRVGKNTVSFADPSVIQELYAFGSDYEKSRFYSHFAVVPGTMMSTLPNKEHAAKRKSQSPAFSMNLLVNMESYVDSCLSSFCELLDRQISKSRGPAATVEMAEYMQLLALDTIGELAFGKSFQLCEAGRDIYGFLPDLLSFTFGACLAGTLPPIGKLCTRFYKSYSGVRGTTALREHAQRCVAERVTQMQESEGEDRRDILAKVMTAVHPDGSKFSIRDVTVTAGSILGAGSDTTAITLRATLKYIISDPRIYQKVMAELTHAVEEEGLQWPITYADACKLDYFQACLKEALRLHSAVPWTLPRVVPVGGAVLCGHFFPAGTEVAMSPFVVHRRTEAFGPDARTYRPERWLDANAATKKEMERNLLTFGAGARVCIGKNVALMEVSKAIPTLLWKYNMRFTPRSSTSPHKQPGRSVEGVESDNEPWHVVSQWFAVQSDMWVDVSPREAALDM